MCYNELKLCTVYSTLLCMICYVCLTLFAYPLPRMHCMQKVAICLNMILCSFYRCSIILSMIHAYDELVREIVQHSFC